MSKEESKIKFPARSEYVEKITCAFCKGVGKDPFGIMSRESTCSVCHGLKEHYILKPYSRCAYCKGTGVEFGTRNSCLSCHGRGYVSQHEGKLVICTSCGGGGMERDTGLTCHACHGSGVV